MIETIDPTANIVSVENAPLCHGMVITDLDGTLIGKDGRAGVKNLSMLHALGKKSVLRVIATGRHLLSLFGTITSDFPADFVIFSSGAGIFDMRSKKIVRSITLEPAETRIIQSALYDLQLDYMIHEPVPHNHKFRFFRFNPDNTDFSRRLNRYNEYSAPLERPLSECGFSSQAIAIVEGENGAIVYASIKSRLADFTVIRTTSPLDGESTWIEMFPSTVSKGSAGAWLASRYGIERSKVLAVGNDYNDIDMLEWAGASAVVANAAPELKTRFNTAPPHDEGGFAWAVERFAPFP